MVTGYFLHLGKMKIVRVLPSGKVVLCSDTSRVNRGEVYYLEQEYVYRVMPCVFFHLNGNSRRLALQEMQHLIDKFGFAYHIENATLASRGAEDARVYSADYSFIAGAQSTFSEDVWHKIWGYTLDFNTPNTVVNTSQLDLTQLFTSLVAVSRWLTFNGGDWFVYGLLPTAVALQSPARVRLFANENLVLDELIRS